MITSIEPQIGRLLLLVGPHSIRHTMLLVIAGLAQREPLHVLDSEHSPENRQVDWFEVAGALRGQPQALYRITIARAFSCYHLLSLLQKTPSMPSYPHSCLPAPKN